MPSLTKSRVLLGFCAVLVLSSGACGRSSNAVTSQNETLLANIQGTPLPASTVGHFQSLCSNSAALRYLQFGPEGRTILATCGIGSPFKQATEPVDNLNSLALSYFRQDRPARSATRVYDVATGDILFELGPLTAAADIRALLPLLRSTGAEPWLVGTNDDNNISTGVVIAGEWSSEVTTIPSAWGQVWAVAQIDSDTIGILYTARRAGLNDQDFPSVFIARVNLTNGSIASNEELDMADANYLVSGASFEEAHLTLSYTTWPRGEGYRDFYGSGSAERTLSLRQFNYRGDALGNALNWGDLSARNVTITPEFVLLADANSPTCPTAVAIVVDHSGNVTNCFRRSSDGPIVEDGYDYRGEIMDSGGYLVIRGEVGLADARFGSNEQQVAHVFEARGAYLGSITARSIGVARDAPLIATLNVEGEGAVLRIGN